MCPINVDVVTCCEQRFIWDGTFSHTALGKFLSNTCISNINEGNTIRDARCARLWFVLYKRSASQHRTERNAVWGPVADSVSSPSSPVRSLRPPLRSRSEPLATPRLALALGPLVGPAREARRHATIDDAIRAVRGPRGARCTLTLVACGCV